MSEKIVLFGASSAGDMAYKELVKTHKILCYLDNDTQKTGKKLNDLLILSPSSFKEKISVEEEVKIVICSDAYDEIKQQLSLLGYHNTKKYISSTNNKIKSYWEKEIHLNPILAGVYGMGGGKELEVPYRHYWETQHLLKIIGLCKNYNVLELGSGNGRWALEISPLVNQYVGIDLNEQMVQYAINCMQENNINNAQFYVNEITDMSLDNKFDIIYFSGVTQYIEDNELKNIIKKIKEYSKENTIIIDRSTVNYKKRYINSSESYFSIYRTPDEIIKIFNDLGYECYYQKRSYPFLRGHKLVNKISNFKRYLSKQVEKNNKLTFSFMKTYSILIEKFFPMNALDSIETSHSHDFFLFRRE